MLSIIRCQKIYQNYLQILKLTTNIEIDFNTRASKSKKLYVERCRLNQQKKSFLRVGARLWNEIPEDVRNLPRRREIRKRLFSILEFEGTYVDELILE